MLKISKRIISLMTATAMTALMSLSVNVSAQTGTYGAMTYEVKTDANNSEYISIINCDESITGELVIPKSIKGITVKEIGKTNEDGGAFNYCKGITSVVIPDTITSIGGGAFYNCTGLTSLHIPGSVESIGENSFLGCSLASLKIDMGVKEIKACAFWENPLTEVDLPESVQLIEKYAFYACGYLKTIIIRNPQCYIENDNSNTLGASSVVYGYDGSTAQAFAIKHGKGFTSMGVAPVRLPGDANLDLKANIRDAAYIARLLANKKAYSLPLCADYNGDGELNIRDAAAIARMLATKI